MSKGMKLNPTLRPSQLKSIALSGADSLADKLNDPKLLDVVDKGKIYLNDPTPENEDAARTVYTNAIHTSDLGVKIWMMRAATEWAKAHKAVKDKSVNDQVRYKTAKATEWAIDNLPKNA